MSAEERRSAVKISIFQVRKTCDIGHSTLFDPPKDG